MAFHAAFGEGVEVWDHNDLRKLDAERYKRLAGLLVESGVWVAARGIWYLSAAHGDNEIDVTLQRAEDAFSSS
jgi:glutamate-1-semialdehyde 2,1-aminomutase